MPSAQRNTPQDTRNQALLDVLGEMLERRFPSYAGRCTRVAAGCAVMARALQLDPRQRQVLAVAARMHDLGMLSIPDVIMAKRGALSDADRAAVRAHAEIGARLTSLLFPDLPEAAEAVRYHHERADGHGFHGLKEPSIPLTAAILSLVSAVEAMTSARLYRPRMGKEAIKAEVNRHAGTQFTRVVVDAFVKVADEVYAAVASAVAPEPAGTAAAAGGAAPGTQGKPHEASKPSKSEAAVEVHSPATTPTASLARPQPAPPAPAANPSPPPVASSAPAPPPSIEPLLTRKDATERLEQAMDRAAPSPVAMRVVAMAGSPRVSLGELTEVIATDPALAARVVHVANSAAYRGQRRYFASVEDAVKQVGCATVLTIASTLSVIDAIPAAQGDCPQAAFSPLRYWQHSLAVAKLCERLLPRQDGDEDAEDEARRKSAYLAGLCHELGTMLFRSHFAKEYAQVLQARAATGKPLEELERQMLGITHLELIVMAFAKLGLPDVVRTPIELLQSGRASTASGRGDALARVLWLADLCANGLLPPDASAPIALITRQQQQSVLQHPARGKQTEPYNPIPARESFVGEILALTATLTGLADRRDVYTPLFAKRPLSIWLARDPMLATLDPVEAALRGLADVTVQTRLPSAEEMSAHAALVVAALSSSSAGLSLDEIQRARSSGGRQVPTLWIILRADAGAAPPPQGIVAMRPPVAINDLAQFIAEAQQQQPGAAQAAAA
ncbi:HDOD domain-containing protein [Fontivita pretiosa]|uniref:HDOD domain-containing protein n=1 Tax=Fontivita pretiosa TaxID=2989684 RepID=UPI003D17ECEA